MKRTLLLFITTLSGIIVLLWLVGRATNTFQFYRCSTVANEPAIKNGSMFFASKLIEPKRLDFICYNVETPEDGKQQWVHRLCGIEGDTVEIRKGELFVNGRNIDSSLSLSNNYIMSEEDFRKLEKKIKMDESFISHLTDDSVSVPLSDNFYRSYKIKAVREILPENLIDGYISKIYSKDWNQDFFGPLIVPFGKYFVLGDNRHNSKDSRYIGLVDKRNYVTTLIGKR